jgi:shikimate dehydrogenase
VSERFALLGHPVAHSLSPAIHQAAYQALGLAHRYELLDTPDEAALAAAVAEVRRGTIRGANVTIPWKRHALALADRAEPSAADVGAANVLARAPDGSVVAHNTDVAALAEEIAALALRPARALVLGAGGAALAAVAALGRLGTREIGVSARRFAAGTPEAGWPLSAELGRLGAVLVPWASPGSAAFQDFATRSQVIVQATSAGMHGAAPGGEIADVLPWDRLDLGTAVYDLVYNPRQTELVRRARARGFKASDGLGMLIGQAALAFELWLGVAPPRDAMWRAAEAELARRAR